MSDIVFRIEGTFTSKPKLMAGDQEVSFETLQMSYYPPESYDYYDEASGESKKQEIPEYVCLAFSLTEKIGALEAKIMYKIKANKDGVLLFEKFVDDDNEPIKDDILTIPVEPSSRAYRKLMDETIKSNLIENL